MQGLELALSRSGSIALDSLSIGSLVERYVEYYSLFALRVYVARLVLSAHQVAQKF